MKVLSNGWIKIHRSILDHWIWQDEKYSRWWITLLLSVNYEDCNFMVGDEIYICKSGESFRSLDEWARLFGCSKKTVVKFFSTLKKDAMVSTKILGNGNRRKHLLIVENWDKYQQVETEKGTKRKPKTTSQGNPNLPSKEEDKKIPKGIKEKEQPQAPIPDFFEFKKFALDKQPKTNLVKLELRYKTWIQSEWKDSNGEYIKDWKIKLMYALEYMYDENAALISKPKLSM